MTTRTFTPADFAKALASDSLRQPIVLTGLVKKAEGPDTLLFSPNTSCLTWVTIPLDEIVEVEWLGKMPCKDHEHDHVKLFLKNAERGKGDFYADLLRASLSSTGPSPCSQVGGPAQPGFSGPVGPPDIADLTRVHFPQPVAGGRAHFLASTPPFWWWGPCWEYRCFKPDPDSPQEVCYFANVCTGSIRWR